MKRATPVGPVQVSATAATATEASATQTRSMDCHIINLQPHLGGAEVYTIFFTRAMLAGGHQVSLYVNRAATCWSGLAAEGHALLSVIAVDADLDIPARLPARACILTHGPVSAAFVAAVRGKHLLTGFCHMPLAGRRAGVLADYDLVFGVSNYVISTLGPAGIAQVYPEALLGVADFSRFAVGTTDTFRQGDVYSWDQRKFRDRVLSWMVPLWSGLMPRPVYQRRPGFTLGIVSNIGPIKQFDVMFRHIAPVIAARPGVNVDVFGNGGWRSVADLKAAMRPIADRVRFWGRQPDPKPLYAHFDCLLSGLPEKEALGLNIIEAQILGTPVLAVNAPPFTETVADGHTGYLFRDPREDHGADFARALDRAMRGPRLDPCNAPAHLARFSPAAFHSRIDRLVQHLQSIL